jgi:hypothetical protein
MSWTLSARARICESAGKGDAGLAGAYNRCLCGDAIHNEAMNGARVDSVVDLTQF